MLGVGKGFTVYMPLPLDCEFPTVHGTDNFFFF